MRRHDIMVRELRRADRFFRSTFRKWVDREGCHIIFAEGIEDMAAFKEILSGFLRKGSITALALCLEEGVPDAAFSCPGVRVTVFPLPPSAFRMVKSLYGLYPICGNITFIAPGVAGMRLPEHTPALDLARMVLS